MEFKISLTQAVIAGTIIFSAYLGGVILALRKARRYVDASERPDNKS